MRRWIKEFLPALALAAGTLFIFGRLQDYGPVSVVRRFHESIRAADAPNAPAQLLRENVQQCLIENISDLEPRRLITAVEQYMLDSQIGLAGTEREPRSVRVLIAYRKPDGFVLPVVFFVEKPQNKWKINATKTETALEHYMETILSPG